MLRRRAGGGLAEKLWLPLAASERMEDEASDFAPQETGGMLVGYLADGAAVVTALIGAGQGAVRGLGLFEPDGTWQQAELARLYQASAWVETYLGDWHSHPSGLARPSGQDKSTARRIARYKEARIKHPITVIVASTRAEQWLIAGFAFQGLWGFRPLEIKAYDPTLR
ncbi:MAG: Mov34/MPN/PAD-1 family protein [Gaiellaceae bacterium]